MWTEFQMCTAQLYSWGDQSQTIGLDLCNTQVDSIRKYHKYLEGYPRPCRHSKHPDEYVSWFGHQ